MNLKPLLYVSKKLKLKNLIDLVFYFGENDRLGEPVAAAWLRKGTNKHAHLDFVFSAVYGDGKQPPESISVFNSSSLT